MSKGKFVANIGEHLISSNWKYNPNFDAFKNSEYCCGFLAKQSNVITSINMLNGSGEDRQPHVIVSHTLYSNHLYTDLLM